MKTRRLWPLAVLLASFVLLLQFSTFAQAQEQEYDDQAPSQDPPSRVGRLDYSQGSVSFRPAGEDDWVTAVPNRPMVTGDDLWTDENSRAEVHVGSTALRIGPRTGITFLDLGDRTTQIRLAQGSFILRVRHLDDDDSYEVDTPNIAFSLLQPGVYRLDVSDDGSRTTATVWHGRARVTGGGITYTVVANQSATFTGNEQHLDYDLGQIPNRDGFDRWAFDRDDREDRSDSANYVSREMTGYEDLDQYGDWSYVAGYGPCWRPRAIVGGWAPYRYGHWAYVGPWGWTWVEDEPWGFAPFHYGRWAFVSNGWFWVPGPVVVRPVWAPALVAFVGGGPGFRFSGGVGVGWFPLAPGEVYMPGYRVSRGYVNQVNVTNTNVNITKVTNVYNTVVINKTVNNVTYVNQRVNNGVTVVSHDTFVNARSASQNVMRVDQREIASAPISHIAYAEPIRSSVVGAGRPVMAKPPVAIMSRPVVAVRTPPPPQRSIEQRQTQVGGRLNEQSLVRPVGPSRPATMNQEERPQPPANEGRAQKPADGFRPFSSPNNGNNQPRPVPNNQPRTFEQQGTPEPANRNAQPENRNAQPEMRSPQPDKTSQPEMRSPQPEMKENQQPPQNRMQQPNRDFRESAKPNPPENHPLVRQAPPVQERTPQQEQQQEQKFNQWHDREQRNAAPPRQAEQPKPQPRPADQKQDKPKK